MDNKIFTICDLIKNITDEEFKDCRAIADNQLNYISPLRPATQAKQNALGEHNHEVLDALQALKVIIERGKDLVDE